MPDAGWYADPGDARQLRYWDGTQWTDHYAPAADAATGTAWGWSPGSPATWRGQDLGLPVSGRGSLGAIERRLAGLLLDALILLPITIVYVVITFPHFVTTTDVSGHTHLHRVARDVPLLVSLVPFMASALYTVPLIAVRGQTIGQRALKLRVVRVQDLARGADAPPPGLDVSVRRFVLPAAAGVIGLFRSISPAAASLVQIPLILDLLWALWDPNRQCLHDKMAGVVVLATEDRAFTATPMWPAA